jgi:hypothetical protein
VVGIFQFQSVGLSKIATYVPGETQAESQVTMAWRWLMNFHVDVWSFLILMFFVVSPLCPVINHQAGE